MALGTGSIRFSQIVSEFEGISPHRFSEYKALAGLGVSGIPSSGTMRFSQFRGKSNQVTTSVWVTSGYESVSWVYDGYGTKLHMTSWYDEIYVAGQWYRITYSPNGRWEGHYGWWLYGDNNNKKVKSGSRYKSGSDWYYAWAYIKVTSWVDTSGYQDQTTTAQIST